MRTFKLLNVVKIVDTDAKAKRLEMLGYKEVVIEEVETEQVEEPEQKKKAPVKKTTKGE